MATTRSRAGASRPDPVPSSPLAKIAAPALQVVPHRSRFGLPAPGEPRTAARVVAVRSPGLATPPSRNGGQLKKTRKTPGFPSFSEGVLRAYLDGRFACPSPGSPMSAQESPLMAQAPPAGPKSPVGDDGWRIPDALWAEIAPLLPPRKPQPLGCHNPRVGGRCRRTNGAPRGRPASAPAARPTAGSRSGSRRGSSASSGAGACWPTTGWRGSAGSGNRSTGR